MKIKNVSDSIKIFFVSLVALSVGLWEIGFNLGAYDTIFFHHIFTVWFVSLAFFFAFLVLPKKLEPCSRWALLPLVMPTLWFVAESVKFFGNAFSFWNTIGTLLGVISLSLCLPYMLYLLLSITQSEALEIRPRRLLFQLLCIAVLIFLIAYFIGENHHLFLTCEDFDRSGSFVPDNCWQS